MIVAYLENDKIGYAENNASFSDLVCSIKNKQHNCTNTLDADALIQVYKMNLDSGTSVCAIKKAIEEKLGLNRGENPDTFDSSRKKLYMYYLSL